MSCITFKRITPEQSNIYDADGSFVGEVFRQRDILNPGKHYYLLWLNEDPRGPHRIFDRARIPDEARVRLLTHPYY